MATSRKIGPIGTILLQLGKIKKEQLEEALKMQQNSEEEVLLGRTLMTMGYVSEQDINEALAMQYNFPYLPLQQYAVSEEVVRLVPLDMIQRYRFFPIEKFEDILVGVMDNPLNKDAIEAIEKYTGCVVRQFYTYPVELDTFIKRYGG